MDKKAEVRMTSGLIVRIIAGLIIISSLPFLIENPGNFIAQIFFAFGNFVLVIGANVP